MTRGEGPTGSSASCSRWPSPTVARAVTTDLAGARVNGDVVLSRFWREGSWAPGLPSGHRRGRSGALERRDAADLSVVTAPREGREIVEFALESARGEEIARG